MSARSQALVPLSAEQQAAWRAVAETEKRRHQGNTLAEYPYAGAFFRCLNGSRRISLSDLRFFMPSLTAEELRGNRSQWLYAVDVLIETQGEVCLLPLPGDAAERLFPSVRFRVRERSRHKSALVMQKYTWVMNAKVNSIHCVFPSEWKVQTIFFATPCPYNLSLNIH